MQMGLEKLLGKFKLDWFEPAFFIVLGTGTTANFLPKTDLSSLGLVRPPRPRLPPLRRPASGRTVGRSPSAGCQACSARSRVHDS